VFYSGTKVDVTGYAKVKTPDTNKAEVLGMKFTLYKIGEDGRETEIINSGEVKAEPPERKTDIDNTLIDRYSAKWQFTIPEKGSYKVLENIYCGWKTAQILSPESNAVLGESTEKKEGAFSFFFSWLNGIFTQKNPSSKTSFQAFSPTITPPLPSPKTTPFDPLKAKSLKLKMTTSNVNTQCTFASFEVVL